MDFIGNLDTANLVNRLWQSLSEMGSRLNEKKLETAGLAVL